MVDPALNVSQQFLNPRIQTDLRAFAATLFYRQYIFKNRDDRKEYVRITTGLDHLDPTFINV